MRTSTTGRITAYFDSVEEFAHTVAAQCQGTRTWSNDWNNEHSWALGLNAKTACERAVSGDASLVAGVSDLVERVSAQQGSTLRAVWEPSVAGNRISVPDYLAGSPTCMRRRVKREANTRAINVYVALVSSAGIDAAHMLKRGAAILAFLQTCQASGIAPTVYLIGEGNGGNDGDGCTLIKVDSQPLDLSVSSFAIAHPAFYRKALFAWNDHHNRWSGAWPKSRPYNSRETEAWYWKTVEEAGGSREAGDVLIPATEHHDELVVRPKAWLAARMAQLGIGGDR